MNLIKGLRKHWQESQLSPKLLSIMHQQQRHHGGEEMPPHQSDMSVGDILRRTRLHYDQTPFDIERALRIKASQVEAIENGQFEKLPGRVYAIGFVRSYSEYLGLDGDKMVSLYKSQSGARADRPEFHFPVAASESKMPQTWLVTASAIIAVGVLVLWWSLGTHDRSIVDNIPPVPASIQAENNTTVGGPGAANDEKVGPPVPPAALAQAQAVSPAQAPGQNPAQATVSAASEPAAGAEKSDGIILKIIQNSWVEIKDRDGKEVVSRVLKAGDKYFVPARPDLFMSLGNSGGVKIEVEGKDLPDIGGPGEVLRNVPLDIELLKKKFSR